MNRILNNHHLTPQVLRIFGIIMLSENEGVFSLWKITFFNNIKLKPKQKSSQHNSDISATNFDRAKILYLFQNAYALRNMFAWIKQILYFIEG